MNAQKTKQQQTISSDDRYNLKSDGRKSCPMILPFHKKFRSRQDPHLYFPRAALEFFGEQLAEACPELVYGASTH